MKGDSWSLNVAFTSFSAIKVQKVINNTMITLVVPYTTLILQQEEVPPSLP